jgi:hypothetical protein
LRSSTARTDVQRHKGFAHRTLTIVSVV